MFEYNMYMSIIDFIQQNINNSIIGKDVSVYPSYPKNSKFANPSIILQKIVGKSESIGMGSDLGQVTIGDIDYDAKGILHAFIYQIDVITNGNIDKLKLSSFMTELFMSTRLGFDPYTINKKEIILKDYLNSEEEIGRIQLIGDIDSNDLQLNPNDDYRTVLRLELEAVQVIIPEYDTVDLSKPINWIQTININ